MGRSPCCEKLGMKKGPWSPEEDRVLISYVRTNGHANWRKLPKHAGLLRCGKSCRLRWINYLRPDIKRGNFTKEEEDTIIRLHESLGNKWSAIAAELPGRTDNEIKNVWHTYLKKKLPGHSVAPKSAPRRKAPRSGHGKNNKKENNSVQESSQSSCNSDDQSSELKKNTSSSLSGSFEDLWLDLKGVDSPSVSSLSFGDGEWAFEDVRVDLETDYSEVAMNEATIEVEDDMKFWYDVFLNSGGTEDLL